MTEQVGEPTATTGKAGPNDGRATWTARGAIWDRTSPQAESTADALNQKLIAAAWVLPGAIVLDMASGAGEPAISIAKHVGPSGLVIAADLVPEMLAGARRRARTLSLGNIRFAIADMTALPFGDAAFDAATCRFGLMFPADPVAAAREARRVLKPGKRIAYAVHGPYTDNAMFKVVRETVSDFFGRPRSDAPIARHRLGERGTLAAILAEAGFADIAETPVLDPVEIPAGKADWKTRLQRSAHDDYESLDEAGRAQLETAVADAFAPYLQGNVYRVPNHAIIGVGTA